MSERYFELPSMTISIPFLMDIVCRCIEGATIQNLIDYTGKSNAYVKGALISATSIGMVSCEVDDQYVTNKECSSSLTSTPTEELKIEVFRSWLQRFEPFMLFIRYIVSGDSPTIAIKKTSSFFTFNRPVESVEKLFLIWAKGIGILDNNNRPCVSVFQPIEFKNPEDLRTENRDNASIRLYLAETLTPAVYAWLDQSEIDELASSFKKGLTDPRSSIECAGRALEDVLRRIAIIKELDVKKQNGISQVANYLYSHRDSDGSIHSSILPKQYSISQAAGDIRNMAGHSKEAKSMERWEISSAGANAYTQMVVTLIKSLYYYVLQSRYAF